MANISWASGISGDWSDAADWSGGAVPGASDNVTIAAAPQTAGVPYSVELDESYSVNAVTMNQASATLELTGYNALTVATTFALKAGTIELDSGTLQGGTYSSTTGSLLVFEQNNYINNVTWQGTLNLVSVPDYYDSVVLNAVTFSGAGATMSVGDGVTAVLNGTQTLNNVTIDLFAGSQIQGDGTLTLGAKTHLSDTSTGYASLGDYENIGPSALLNQGAISVTGNGTVLDMTSVDSLTNTGTISVSAGGSLIISSTTGTNAGLITVGTGGYAELEGSRSLSNTGTLVVAGGVLAIGGNFTQASLGTVKISNGGILGIAGTLTNSATLAIGTGTTLTTISLENGGVISGGAITDAGGGLVAAGGTLSGVTYEGTLNLKAAGARLTVTNGISLEPAGGGTAAGTVQLTGSESDMNLLGSQTISNAVVDIGDTGSYFAQLSIGDTGGPSTVTLASSTSIVQTQEYALISGTETYSSAQGTYGTSGDILVNDGTISSALNVGYMQVSLVTLQNDGALTFSAYAGLELGSGTLANAGTFSLSGGSSVDFYESYTGVADGFTNTGLVTLGLGSTLNLDNSALTWSNAGQIDVAGGILTLGGSFTLAQFGSVTVSSGGSLVLDTDAYLDDTGGTLSVGTGTSLGTVAVSGTIHGGTIADSGAGLNFVEEYNYQTGLYQYGTLDGVTYEGVLTVAAYDSAAITGGITLTTSSGTGAGSISLTNADSELDFASSETLANATISIGSGIEADMLDAVSSSGDATLTLGTGLTINQVGASVILGGSSGTIDNTANLAFADAGGTLTLSGNVVNSGTIAVSNGETLVLATSSLVNTGVISITNGLLAIGNGTAAQLASVKFVNSEIAVTGVLTETGATLTVGTGTSIPVLKLQGTIDGGTIHDAGNGVQFNGFSVLDGVTYEGTVNVNRPLSVLAVLDGLTAESFTGAQPGSIALTGAGSTLAWGSTEALDNATLTIGNPGLSYEGHAVAAPALAAYANYDYYNGEFVAVPVALGAHLTIQQGGTYADIGGQYDYYGGTGPNSYYFDTSQGTFTSAAIINAAVSGGKLALQGESFASTGTIAISNADTVTAAAASTTNAGLITVGANSALNLDLYNYFADASLSDYSFANSGSMSLAGGSIDELTDGGTFPGVAMLNAAGASITGFGTIAAPIVNDGIVAASGGTLSLAQAASGTGTFNADAGATLNLSSLASGGIAGFSGTGGVLGLSPATFLGAIAGFASGDTIDLANTVAKSAAFVHKTIVVTLSSGSKITLTTTSALTGSLTVTAGTQGDSLITFASAKKHGPPVLPPLHPAGSVQTKPIAYADRGLGFAARPEASHSVEWGHLGHA